MNRYLLTFTKENNMRFISHLDLQRLFQRAIKRGEIKVAYSNGFNPHELINIVSPLSLGFESVCEILEITTLLPYEVNDLLKRFNKSMPQGMSFVSGLEVERKNKTTSCCVTDAEYVAIVEENVLDSLKIDDFLAQNEILIQKRDKKTKLMVDKNVKDLIHDIKSENGQLSLNLSCGSNSTANPMSVINSLYTFSGIELKQECVRIKRVKLNYTLQ